jgi:ATP-dependent Lon protease
MEININIEEIVAEAVREALAPEKLQPIITSNVEKSVKSAIEESFSYRSPFNEYLKQKVAEAMPTDIENMGRFGDLVLKTVTAYVNDSQREFIRQAIEPKLASMLRKLPHKMKLTTLVDMIMEDLKDDHRRQGAERPTILVEQSNGSITGYWQLHIDPRSNVSHYTCRIHAYFDAAGRCFSLRVDGEDMQSKLLIGPTYNTDALFLNLYTNGVLIELDQVDFEDVYYPDAYQD